MWEGKKLPKRKCRTSGVNSETDRVKNSVLVQALRPGICLSFLDAKGPLKALSALSSMDCLVVCLWMQMWYVNECVCASVYVCARTRTCICVCSTYLMPGIFFDLIFEHSSH